MGPATASLARRSVPPLLFAAGVATLVGIGRGARLEPADVVFNNGAEVATLDPATVSGVPEGRVLTALYEGLTVKHPRTLEPLPGMAERWELSTDGRTWTFHLRPEARWNNGDPLTAHDFEWSWRRLLEPETAAEYAYLLWSVRNAKPYALLPDDRWYSGPARGTWLRVLEDGRARVGLHGFHPLSPPASADSAFHVPLRAGDAVARDTPLVATDDGRRCRAWAEGTVTTVNPDLPRTLGELFEDPYRHWIVELDVQADALEALRADDVLLPAVLAREGLFWPAVGIRATDERTLVVELETPVAYFLDLTSYYPTFPVHRPTLERARAEHPQTWQTEWVRPEELVTNGPYRIVERRVNDRIRVVKNPLYWDADNVAMRTIDILAVEHFGTMLNMYLTGAIDWIDRCAPSLIPRLLPREDFEPRPYLGSYFYRFNVTRPPFDDVRVRRALALAVDRRAICERVMKKGEEPLWSLCPDGLEGYVPSPMARATPPTSGVGPDEALAADCALARELLAEAGYGPGGEPFPAFEIHYNTAETHRDLAEVVADGWKRFLGIDARLSNQEWKVFLDSQKRLDYGVSRSVWTADYPDPNTFLELFVTDGTNNRTGWGDPRYDALIDAARRELDAARRLELLSEAEAVLMEGLPILPLFGYVSQNLVNPRLGGFHDNPQDEHPPKFWYWMDDVELAERRAARAGDQVLVPAPGPAQGLYSPAERRRRGTLPR